MGLSGLVRLPGWALIPFVLNCAVHRRVEYDAIMWIFLKGQIPGFRTCLRFLCHASDHTQTDLYTGTAHHWFILPKLRSICSAMGKTGTTLLMKRSMGTEQQLAARQLEREAVRFVRIISDLSNSELSQCLNLLSYYTKDLKIPIKASDAVKAEQEAHLEREENVQPNMSHVNEGRSECLWMKIGDILIAPQAKARAARSSVSGDVPAETSFGNNKFASNKFLSSFNYPCLAIIANAFARVDCRHAGLFRTINEILRFGLDSSQDEVSKPAKYGGAELASRPRGRLEMSAFGSLTPQCVSNLVNACARVEVEHSKDLLQNLVPLVTRLASDMEMRALASICHAYAKYSYSSTSLWQSLCVRTLEQLDVASSQALVITLHSLSKVFDTRFSVNDELHQLCPIVQSIFNAAAKRLSNSEMSNERPSDFATMTPQCYANLFNTYGRMTHLVDKEELSRLVSRLMTEIANIFAPIKRKPPYLTKSHPNPVVTTFENPQPHAEIGERETRRVYQEFKVHHLVIIIGGLAKIVGRLDVQPHELKADTSRQSRASDVTCSLNTDFNELSKENCFPFKESKDQIPAIKLKERSINIFNILGKRLNERLDECGPQDVSALINAHSRTAVPLQNEKGLLRRGWELLSRMNNVELVSLVTSLATLPPLACQANTPRRRRVAEAGCQELLGRTKRPVEPHQIPRVVYCVASLRVETDLLNALIERLVASWKKHPRSMSPHSVHMVIKSYSTAGTLTPICFTQFLSRSAFFLPKHKRHKLRKKTRDYIREAEVQLSKEVFDPEFKTSRNTPTKATVGTSSPLLPASLIEKFWQEFLLHPEESRDTAKQLGRLQSLARKRGQNQERILLMYLHSVAKGFNELNGDKKGS